MENHIAAALMEFYQKILKPDLDSVRQKQAEHDEKFSEMLGHLEALERQLAQNGRLTRL